MSRLTSGLALLGLLMIATSGRGQYYGQPQQPQVPRTNLQCEGTVKQLSPAGIGLDAGEGGQWLVQLDPSAREISYSGSGDGTIVKPGQWVRFSTKLTRRGSTVEPVASLAIFTPGQMDFIGVASEASLAASSGGGAAAGAGELFSDTKKPEEKPKAKPKEVKEDENTIYQVAGQISRISRLGELSINAGGTTIKAELAEPAKVSIAVSDLSWLQVGDKVEMRGWHVTGQKGAAWATQISASGSQPLTDLKKKPKPAPSATEGEKPAESEKPAEGAKPAEGEKKAE
ncbi:MAG: hypothetical protein SFU86_17360 [Pirellulaceae bacterium]|nr:hypothetical protein [Pirellulaceae bacterium]